MSIKYFSFYKKKPSVTINDILYKKQHLRTHKNYFSFAQSILSYNFCTQNDVFYKKIALNKFIRILTIDIQSRILKCTLDSQPFSYSAPIFCEPVQVCPKCGTIHNYMPKSIIPNTPVSFNISKNPTLSFPWNPERLINALGTIDSSCDNSFLFKPLNHFGSILLEPINLLILRNGYHSSVSGIYDENAIYYPEEIWDISGLYKEIYFDGIAFRHKLCNTVLEYPNPKSIGTIYEIGRLLCNKNMTLFSLLQ